MADEHQEYREELRRSLTIMSDEALEFHAGIDRGHEVEEEEIKREQDRRRRKASSDDT